MCARPTRNTGRAEQCRCPHDAAAIPVSRRFARRGGQRASGTSVSVDGTAESLTAVGRSAISARRRDWRVHAGCGRRTRRGTLRLEGCRSAAGQTALAGAAQVACVQHRTELPRLSCSPEFPRRALLEHARSNRCGCSRDRESRPRGEPAAARECRYTACCQCPGAGARGRPARSTRSGTVRRGPRRVRQLDVHSREQRRQRRRFGFAQ